MDVTKIRYLKNYNAKLRLPDRKQQKFRPLIMTGCNSRNHEACLMEVCLMEHVRYLLKIANTKSTMDRQSERQTEEVRRCHPSCVSTNIFPCPQWPLQTTLANVSFKTVPHIWLPMQYCPYQSPDNILLPIQRGKDQTVPTPHHTKGTAVGKTKRTSWKPPPSSKTPRLKILMRIKQEVEVSWGERHC